MQSFLKQYPGTMTLLLTIIGYGLVIGTLYSETFSFLYPQIQLGTVNLLSHLIAANNTLTIICLVMGWYYIRQGDVDTHPKLMTLAFGLIMLFLVMYLIKTGGGGRKEFVGPPVAWWSYIVMLGTHILLSIMSVPMVLYTLMLGATRSIDEVYESVHARVGQWAAGAWILSLFLGVVAYVLLHHVYTFEFVAAG